MENLISINQRRVFTIEDVRNILPIIYRITEDHHGQVKILANRLRALRETQSDMVQKVEDEINVIIEAWNGKISRLGAAPKGLWLADFDNGKGYYCWKFPETDVHFHHDYHEGFSGRTRLDDSKA